MSRLTRVLPLAVLACLLPVIPSGYGAPGIDRTAVDWKAPAEIKWVRNAAGTNESAVLFGDPSKPGPYVVRLTGPASAGSYVVHYANKVHYDGAKAEETIIQVWGMGPATSTPAEKR